MCVCVFSRVTHVFRDIILLSRAVVGAYYLRSFSPTKGRGKYAVVSALLIGLTAFLSLLLLAPRLGGGNSRTPVAGKRR